MSIEPYKVKFVPYRKGLGEIMLRQTEGGGGYSSDGRYRFYIDEEVENPDFWVVQGKGLRESQTLRVAPANTVLLTTEPRSVLVYPQSYIRQFGLLCSCQEKTKHSNHVLGPPILPWFVGYTEVSKGKYIYTKDYDILSKSETPKKTRLLSVITSNKAFTQGHLDRICFVEKLKERYGDQIDIYGRGFRDFGDKWNVLAPYKYHIVLENSSQPYYWTEKISDCFLTETFPFYYGCTNLGDFFPENSFQPIDILDFEKAVGTIDSLIENETFEKRLFALKESKGLVLEKYNIFNYIASLCDRLNPSLPKEQVTLHECHTMRNWHNFYNYTVSRNLFKLKRKIKEKLGVSSSLKLQ